jgi:hypothetical protein
LVDKAPKEIYKRKIMPTANMPRRNTYRDKDFYGEISLEAHHQLKHRQHKDIEWLRNLQYHSYL